MYRLGQPVLVVALGPTDGGIARWRTVTEIEEITVDNEIRFRNAAAPQRSLGNEGWLQHEMIEPNEESVQRYPFGLPPSPWFDSMVCRTQPHWPQAS
jgi:hypothetical protein